MAPVCMIDIVIPTLLKEPKYLLHCLHSILASDFLDGSVTVWVVANCDDARMITVREEFLQHNQINGAMTIHWHALGENRGFTGAVNYGAGLGNSPLIILLNDDTIITSNWITDMYQTWKKAASSKGVAASTASDSNDSDGASSVTADSVATDSVTADSVATDFAKLTVGMVAARIYTFPKSSERYASAGDTESLLDVVMHDATAEVDSLGFSFLWRGKAPVLKDTLLQSQNEPIRRQETETLASNQHVVDLPDYWQKYLLNVVDKDSNSGILHKEPFGPDAAAALYTRKMWEELGGMQQSFFAYLEDVDFALRARLQGYQCVLQQGTSRVYHAKHATSSHFSFFKHQQDILNWWRIVLFSYPRQIWFRYFPAILIERMRNVWGAFKMILTKDFA